MATKKKKKGSYNPFYIPSLDALKAQARQEAQAQVDASLASLPQQSTIEGQFAKTGRETQAMDTAYVNFLKNQQLAAPALENTGIVAPQQTTATGTMSPEAEQMAAAGRNALSMSGFGFANARQAAISGAQGQVGVNQNRNRRALNDAILNLQQQQATEKAKFSPLYFQTLNQKKADAMQAYQAYLNSQFQSANAAAGLSVDQAKLDISQQNADTAANRAAAAAAKDAGKTGKDRIKRRDAVYKWVDTQLGATLPTTSTKTYNTWTFTYTSGVPPVTKTMPIELPASVSQEDAFNQVKQQHPTIHFTGGSITGHRNEDTKGTTRKYNFNWVYKHMRDRLIDAGYTYAQARRLAHRYLDDESDLVGSPAWKKKAADTGRPGGDK